MTTSPTDVLAFWREAGPEKWFKKDTAFDYAIRARFLATYGAAAAGELADWEQTADGALALTIVLDQFPRNMFRNDSRAFAADPVARAVAGRALAQGFDRDRPITDRQFFYLPFEHSENLADQERCCALFAATGDADPVAHEQGAVAAGDVVEVDVVVERSGVGAHLSDGCRPSTA